MPLLKLFSASVNTTSLSRISGHGRGPRLLDLDRRSEPGQAGRAAPAHDGGERDVVAVASDIADAESLAADEDTGAFAHAREGVATASVSSLSMILNTWPTVGVKPPISEA